jgi:hypothetical protein
MLGRFTAILSRLNPVSDGSTTARDVTPDSGTTADGDRDGTVLYECPSCETVFIAVDKQRCEDCAQRVVQLDGTY